MGSPSFAGKGAMQWIKGFGIRPVFLINRQVTRKVKGI